MGWLGGRRRAESANGSTTLDEHGQQLGEIGRHTVVLDERQLDRPQSARSVDGHERQLDEISQRTAVLDGR